MGKKITLPLIPIRGVSILPHKVLHFDVGRKKSIKALEKAMVENQKIFLTAQKESAVELPTTDDFYKNGVVCKVKQMLKLPGDAIRVLVEGIERAKIEEVIKTEDYFEVFVDAIDKIEISFEDHELEARKRTVFGLFKKYIMINKKISPEILFVIEEINDVSKFVDKIAANLSVKTSQMQKIVEAWDLDKRLKIITDMLISEIEILKIKEKINVKVKNNIDEMQKQMYLKQQMKSIKEELGESFDKDDEIQEMREKLDELELDEKIYKKVERELNRLSVLSASSAEAGVIRNYVDWILNLPWNEISDEDFDLTEAKRILNEDHYGLKDVKERVIEYLAIQKLTNGSKGPIICLVGPPGVGKTSIAKSIARALNREFVRMSLGGVRDESEIRGHRRTYVGAIPGRIIASIKESGTKNPVFLFDEIDKIGSDFKGDPASALLEVLDPEQNSTFTDRYLEIPFDLSKVMFLTTANTLSTIPRPLRDRMEIIEVSGYTQDEKLKIATKYLVNKQIEEHGLKADQLSISENALKAIIAHYTRESGVRTLERKIAKLVRKSATRIVKEGIDSLSINTLTVEKYLGVKQFEDDKIHNENKVGIVRGLAWTSVGGDTLSIEVNSMPGKGKLELTGQLGDVMKESARAGLSYIRSKIDTLNLDQEFYKKVDLHIHIPKGAIPKDGPSAGITMATAMISELTNTPVSNDVAMTGEITLRGRVLPIGGLKEKSLAAQRAGVTKIILPEGNRKNLEEVPENVQKSLEFVFVESMDQVLEHALVKDESDENK